VLEGLSNSDDLIDLKLRIEELPPDLKTLFDNLLNRLDKTYFERACQAFRLLRAWREAAAWIATFGYRPIFPESPTLLQFYFADNRDVKLDLNDSLLILSQDEINEKVDLMRRRLVTRCRGFLTLTADTADNGTSGKQVSYLHRTARDFIESDDYWPLVVKGTQEADFNPE